MPEESARGVRTAGRRTAMGQPGRRYTLAASAASDEREHPQQKDLQRLGEQQQQQQHRQGGCGGFAGGRSDANEVIGWRARAAAAAAAAATEENSWWSSTDTSGEPLVVPPLLLPLLPSIFCLHARPWPPPPTKRRRLISRRRRGFECFATPAVAAQCPLWGSGFAQREGQRQQTGPANTAAAGGGAAKSCPAPPHLAHAPAAAKAADAGAEQAAPKRSQSKGELGQSTKNDAADVECMAPCSCSPQCSWPPWLTSDTDKTTESTAARSAAKCGYCCSHAACLQGRIHEVLLRKQKEGQSEPAFESVAATTSVTATPTAAAVCAAAAVRDMAAVAAAATLTGQQKHEEQTPPPRFRRRSLNTEASRSTAGAAMAIKATVTAAATATAAKPAAGGTSPGRQCSTNPSAAAAALSAAGQPSEARELLLRTAGGRVAAPIAAAARPCACCSWGAGDPVPSCPASFEEADALPISHTRADEGADSRDLDKGSAVGGVGKGTYDKGLENGLEKGLEGKASVKSSSGKDPDKGSYGGLGRGSGNGGTGGCLRSGSIARISQGLLVGGSSLGRGSGLGIYTCRAFSRRALICEYSGILIDRSTALLLRHMECASHVVNVQMQHMYLLGFHTPFPLLGGGAFINDGRWNTRGKEGPGICVRFRVMFDKHRATQRVVVVAVKDIPKGTELLTSYDNDYWRLQKGVRRQRMNR